MLRVISICIAIMMILQGSVVGTVHSLMDMRTHDVHVQGQCAGDDCPTPIDCATECLNAVQKVDFIPTIFPLFFALLVSVVALYSIPYVYKLYQWLKEFWYFPHYLFSTVILRE